jgi:hypothetical protein
MSCWLCKYHGTPDCKRVSAYISDSAGEIDIQQMALSIHEDLGQLDDIDITMDQILEHLTSHTLHPALKVSGIMKRLHTVEETLSMTLISKDDDGNAIVDGKNVQVYLKVIAEIIKTYNAEIVQPLKHKRQS